MMRIRKLHLSADTGSEPLRTAARQRAALSLLLTHHYKGMAPALCALSRFADVSRQCPCLCCSLDRWVRCHGQLADS